MKTLNRRQILQSGAAETAASLLTPLLVSSAPLTAEAQAAPAAAPVSALFLQPFRRGIYSIEFCLAFHRLHLPCLQIPPMLSCNGAG